MNRNPSKATENSTSERFSELWQALNHNQRRFAVAMLECSTKAEAAEAIDIKPDTVYRWGDEVDECIDLMVSNAKDSAVGMLTSALHKAVMVKLAGMDEDDPRVRQDAASEVIDRVLGKATQHSEISGPGGAPLIITEIVVEHPAAGDGRDDEL